MKLSEICELFVCLPPKDIPIANKLLFNRDFLELKALIDSDVYKIERQKRQFLSENNDITNIEYIALEEKEVKLLQLQNVVNDIAAAFSNDDIENYYEPDEF